MTSNVASWTVPSVSPSVIFSAGSDASMTELIGPEHPDSGAARDPGTPVPRRSVLATDSAPNSSSTTA